MYELLLRCIAIEMYGDRHVKNVYPSGFCNRLCKLSSKEINYWFLHLYILSDETKGKPSDPFY